MRELKLIKRAVILRQARLILPIWIDQGQIRMALDEYCTFGERRIGWPEFERLIEAAEALAAMPARKPAASAEGAGEREEATA